MTTPATPKKVVSVEVLHLDELGYGPQGQHTRRQWRAECLENLLAGKAQFEAWQDSWKDQIKSDLPSVSFGYYVDFMVELTRQQAGFLNNAFTLDFIGQQFDRTLDAKSFNFKLTPDFTYAIFDLTADFSKATFVQDVVFIDAYFTGSANFNNTIFSNFALFNKAKFSNYVDFSGVIFAGFTIFSDVIFCQDANFRLATFHEQCLFNNGVYDQKTQEYNKVAIFSAQAIFENAAFKNVGHFEGVKFTNNIPSFLGVDTATTRLEFSDDTHFAWHDVTENAVKRLGHLKRLADEHGQIDQALTFNALELHAKAAQPTASIANKLVTGAYAMFSDYGRSFTLPIFWFGFLLWMSFLFAFGNYNQYKNIVPNVQCANLAQNITISKPRAAFEYAMFRASGVLDFNDADKQNHTVNCQLFKQPIEPWWMRMWGIFKAIASLALLFLAALGLRNNYRIK